MGQWEYAGVARAVRTQHPAGPSWYSTFAGRSDGAVAREAANCEQTYCGIDVANVWIDRRSGGAFGHTQRIETDRQTDHRK